MVIGGRRRGPNRSRACATLRGLDLHSYRSIFLAAVASFLDLVVVSAVIVSAAVGRPRGNLPASLLLTCFLNREKFGQF